MIDAARLRSVPLFGDLDEYDLAHVARWVVEVRAEPGESLIEQGSMPYELFVIEEERSTWFATGNPWRRSGWETSSARSRCSRGTVGWPRWSPGPPVRALALHVDALQELTEEMPELGDELRALMERRRAENDPG